MLSTCYVVSVNQYHSCTIITTLNDDSYETNFVTCLLTCHGKCCSAVDLSAHLILKVIMIMVKDVAVVNVKLLKS